MRLLAALLPLQQRQGARVFHSKAPRLSTGESTGSPVPSSAAAAAGASAASPSAAAPKRLRVLQSHVHDPFFNIAFEGRLFAQILAAAGSATPPPDHTLYLWSNGPSVIVGKHQNAYREVSLPALRAEGVNLVRRHSGGGAVYHDRGNAIFTFVSRDNDTNKAQHNNILLQALTNLGIQGARTSGRNDIEVLDQEAVPAADGSIAAASARKVSGAAFRREKGWLLHHGTMLVHVDLAALPKLLTPSKAKLEAKGVASVAARVRNLDQMVPGLKSEQWDRALLEAFLKEHGADASVPSTTAAIAAAAPVVPVIEHVHPSDIPALYAADPLLEAGVSALRSFDWVLGANPSFSHEHSARLGAWGSVTLGFRVGKGGRIEEARAYSDALVAPMVDEINAALATLVAPATASDAVAAMAGGSYPRYSRESIDAALVRAEESCRAKLGEEAAKHVRELRDWMDTQL